GITISPRKTSLARASLTGEESGPAFSYIGWLTAPTTAQSRLLSRAAFGWNRRREERSDAAIQWAVGRVAVTRFPPGTKSRGSQWRAGLTQVQFTLSALSPLAPPRRLGHRGQRRLAVGPGEHVRDHAFRHRPPGLDRGRADMGQEHRIVERDQLLGHARFVLEHIEPRGQDPARPQSLDQRLLVHERAARDVDQHAVGTERVHNFGVDDVAR